MHPARLAIILLVLFSLAFWAAPSSFAQRRVFTNEDFPKPAAPPAPPAPAATPAPAAEGVPAAEDASAEQPDEPDASLPLGLELAESLQVTLRGLHAEVVLQLEQEIDSARQERLKTMMDLTMQLLTHNQLFIADLKAQQEAAAEAEAQAQAGAQPAP